MEWCTSCSTETSELNELTGWCMRCTTLYYLERELLICQSCSKVFPRDNQFRLLCSVCRDQEWEARYADEIERWIGAGLAYPLARKKVAEHNRPVCLNCGSKIKMGTKGRHFLCRANADCRQVSRRYKLYWYQHGMPKDEALEKALQIQKDKRADASIIAALRDKAA